MQTTCIISCNQHINSTTKTALSQIQNGILKAVDNRNADACMLLDLSAAFDTVDRTVLLSKFCDYVGLKGKAIAWFDSYLSN